MYRPRQYKNIEYATAKCNAYHGCLEPKLRWKHCGVGWPCWFYRRAVMLGANPKVKGYDPVDPCKPTFEPKKLDVLYKWKQPQRIAMSFMGDIAYAKVEWMQEIFKAINSNPQHWYYFLTKLPKNLEGLWFPDQCYVGVTVNRQADVHRIDELRDFVDAYHYAVSFEPVYEQIQTDLTGIEWIWIGAQTNPDYQPKVQWVTTLEIEARKVGAKVFMKDNLKREYLPLFVQEFPEGMI